MYLTELTYYVICLDFKFRKLYIIWILDEIEKVAVDSNNKIIAFDTKDKLIKYAHKNNIVFEKDLTTYNINNLQQWIISPNDKFNREEFLNYWNLCTDISASINIRFTGDVKNKLRNKIYDKLFDASGVFIAEDPNPVFDETEIATIAEVMQNGLALLIDNLCINGNTLSLT